MFTAASRFQGLARAGNSPILTFANTVLLLTMDDLVDHSPNGLVGTLAGSAALTTAQTKFGSKSLALTGPLADGLKYASNALFDLQLAGGDWTQEAWVFPTDVSSGSQQALFVYNGAVGGNQNPYTMITGANLHWRGVNTGNALHPAVAHGMAVNTWNFLSQVKKGDTFSTYINGNRIAVATTPGFITDENKSFSIGGGGVVGGFKGNVAHVRLSNIARYFGPTCPVPTGPFPTS
jgi:hypothetical protein